MSRLKVEGAAASLQDSAKIPEFCQQALEAISYRMPLVAAPMSPLPIPTRTRRPEREEVKEAIILLYIHQNKFQGALAGYRVLLFSWMVTDWLTPYRAALREQDPARLTELCEKARRAIHDRLFEPGQKIPDAREREELDEALRQLTLRELKPRPN